MPLALVVLVGLCACGKKQPALELDAPTVEQQLAARTGEVLLRPNVRSALDGLVVSAAGDPAVGAVADKLVDRLAVDTPLANAGIQLVARLQRLPAVQELVQTHPGLPPEQLGALVRQKLDAAFRQPKLAATVDDLWKKLGEQLGTAGVLRKLARRIECRAACRARIVETAGGNAPPPARAAELFADNALRTERLEALALAVLGSPAARGATAKLLAGLLGVPAITKEVHRAITSLASEPARVEDTVALFDLLLSSQIDEVVIDTKMRNLLFSPRVVGIAAGVVRVAVDAPESAPLAEDALAALAADPAVSRAYDALVNGW